MSGIIDGYTTLGAGVARDALLRQMDGAGVERAVVAPGERELAVYNTEGNERILSEAKCAGGRFIPACVATPWRGGEAAAILERAAAAGARLIVFAPAVQGFMMTDDIVAPLLARAGELALPVYVHTGPHGMGAPTQTVLAALRHPGTRFIVGHCGSTDHARDMIPIAGRHLGANLFLETSLARPWAVPRYLVARCPLERLLWGTDTVSMNVDARRYRVPLMERVGLSERQETAIYHANPERIFRL